MANYQSHKQDINAMTGNPDAKIDFLTVTPANPAEVYERLVLNS